MRVSMAAHRLFPAVRIAKFNSSAEPNSSENSDGAPAMASAFHPSTPTTHSTRPNSIMQSCVARRNESLCIAASACVCSAESRGCSLSSCAIFSTQRKFAETYVLPTASHARTARMPNVSSAVDGSPNSAGSASGCECTPNTSKHATAKRIPRLRAKGDSAEASRCSRARRTAGRLREGSSSPEALLLLLLLLLPPGLVRLTSGKLQMKCPRRAKSKSRGSCGRAVEARVRTLRAGLMGPKGSCE
mmetsp:Transcript_10017/g.18936  ORF Transcript_10017/g.18936 Transcript_10017/m.18936 type:complete len:245 (-) Transcript_10017:821-1555(-)